MAITAIEPTETMLATPIHALLRIARLSFDEAIFPEVPLTALQLFTINIRVFLDMGRMLIEAYSLQGSTEWGQKCSPSGVPAEAPLRATQRNAGRVENPLQLGTSPLPCTENSGRLAAGRRWGGEGL
jgi:hypothetical protein